MTTSLVSLPRGLLIHMLSKLDLSELGRLCSTTPQISNICSNRDFWAYKYQQEFNEAFPSSNSNSNPQLTYLRRLYTVKTQEVQDAKDVLHDRLKFIFLEATDPSQSEAVIEVFNHFIHHLKFPPNKEKVEAALNTLNEYGNHFGNDLLIDGLIEDLTIWFGNANITEVYGISHGDMQTDEEVEGVYRLARRILEAQLDWLNNFNFNNDDLKKLEKQVFTKPFGREHRYMTNKEVLGMHRINIDNKMLKRAEETRNNPVRVIAPTVGGNILRAGRARLVNRDILPPIINDTNSIPRPLPSNLPPPPPRAPMLLTTTKPIKLPLPPYPDVGPPLFREFPPNLPPPPPRR